MSNIKPSVTEVKALAKVLDEGTFTNAADMALAALEMAYAAYEDRARFVIAGQLYYRNGAGYVKDNGDRVAFGPYDNLTPATAAGEQLAYSANGGEEFKWWLLPYHQGTPAQWFKQRKQIRAEVDEVPLTSAEKLIIRRNPDQAHRWGLDPTGGLKGKGGRLHQQDEGDGRQEPEAA